MDKTKIQWTDATWNPVTGCSKVSSGCKNCYAEAVAGRWWGERKFTDVQTHADRLDQPLRWRRPRRVFVNSMSDLFHDAVPDAFIDRVFAVMALAPQHTFQVLTKRPERMLAYCRTLGRHHESDRVSLAAKSIEADRGFSWRLGACGWHLPNVWLGVSVEDQRAADERIPLLLQTPSAVRFLSCEPLLGPVDLRNLQQPAGTGTWHFNALYCDVAEEDDEPFGGACVDWVIAGGESGPGARPCDVTWIRSLVDQCQAAGVPAFVKQLGAKPTSLPCYASMNDRLRDRKGGDPSEWPEDLRVREFPAVEARS